MRIQMFGYIYQLFDNFHFLDAMVLLKLVDFSFSVHDFRRKNFNFLKIWLYLFDFNVRS